MSFGCRKYWTRVRRIETINMVAHSFPSHQSIIQIKITELNVQLNVHLCHDIFMSFAFSS